MPLARLTHSFDDDAVALWNANFEQGVAVAKATDAKEVWLGKGPVIPTTHLHGRAIMGTGWQTPWSTAAAKPTKSPTCGWPAPAPFPSEGASNPTYTIFAVSQRGAEHLAATWKMVAS